MANEGQTTPGRDIANAVIALSAAMARAGLPAPEAIVLPDRTILRLVEAMIMRDRHPWLIDDPACNGREMQVHGVKIRSAV